MMRTDELLLCERIMKPKETEITHNSRNEHFFFLILCFKCETEFTIKDL